MWVARRLVLWDAWMRLLRPSQMMAWGEGTRSLCRDGDVRRGSKEVLKQSPNDFSALGWWALFLTVHITGVKNQQLHRLWPTKTCAQWSALEFIRRWGLRDMKTLELGWNLLQGRVLGLNSFRLCYFKHFLFNLNLGHVLIVFRVGRQPTTAMFRKRSKLLRRSTSLHVAETRNPVVLGALKPNRRV